MKHDVDGDGSAIQSPRRPDGSLGSPKTIREREHVDRALDRGGRSPHELDRRRVMQAGTAPVADFQSVRATSAEISTRVVTVRTLCRRIGRRPCGTCPSMALAGWLLGD